MRYGFRKGTIFYHAPSFVTTVFHRISLGKVFLWFQPPSNECTLEKSIMLTLGNNRFCTRFSTEVVSIFLSRTLVLPRHNTVSESINFRHEFIINSKCSDLHNFQCECEDSNIYMGLILHLHDGQSLAVNSQLCCFFLSFLRPTIAEVENWVSNLKKNEYI